MPYFIRFFTSKTVVVGLRRGERPGPEEDGQNRATACFQKACELNSYVNMKQVSNVLFLDPFLVSFL